MTLLEIYANVARRTDKNPTVPNAETKARILTFVNDRYRELMRIPGVIDLRDEPFTLTTVVGQNRYALPAALGPIASVVNSTRRLVLAQRTLAWIRQRDPSVPGQVSGTPWVYALLNNAGVGAQPTITTFGALDVVSTNAGDTSLIEIEYMDQFGGFRVHQQAVNGTTPQSITATVVQVFRVTYLGAALGAISLRQTTGAVTLALLPPTDIVAPTGNAHAGRAWVLYLWPTPAGADSYIIDAARPRMTLVNDLDEPAIPEDFHTLLVWGACEDEMLKMDDDRADAYGKRWKTDLAALKAYLHMPRGQRLIPTGSTPGVGWTPMGSNFPAWQ